MLANIVVPAPRHLFAEYQLSVRLTRWSPAVAAAAAAAAARWA